MAADDRRVIEAIYEFVKASRAWVVSGHAEYAEAARLAEAEMQRAVADLVAQAQDAKRDLDIARAQVGIMVGENDAATDLVDSLARERDEARADFERVEAGNRALLATAARLEAERDDVRARHRAYRDLMEQFIIRHAEDDYEVPHVCDLCDAAHALLVDDPEDGRTAPGAQA